MGHCVFIHKGSIVGAKGTKFRVTLVLTVPSVIYPPSFVNLTIMDTGEPGTGGSGVRASSVGSKKVLLVPQDLTIASVNPKMAKSVYRTSCILYYRL